MDITDRQIPYIDQIKYLNVLQAFRKDLNDWRKLIGVLRLRTEFRKCALDFQTSFESHKLFGYSTELEKLDTKWQDSHRLFQVNIRESIQSKVSGEIKTPYESLVDRLSDFSYYPGFYDLESFASYQIGKSPWKIVDGFVYKVIFEFTNPVVDLTPECFEDFAKHLADNGFEGDAKIPLLFGWVRFQFNNVIIHASTIQLALLAESLGLKFFSGKLSGYTRGVDVCNNISGCVGLDWHHFLCIIGPSELPQIILAFVKP